MDGPYDWDWLERLLKAPSPPTPPRRKVPVVAAQVAPPDLFCAETVPPPTCAGWPQTYNPWKPQVPLGYMAAPHAMHAARRVVAAETHLTEAAYRRYQIPWY